MDKKEITKQINNLKLLTEQLESVIVKFINKESDTSISRLTSQLSHLDIKKLKQEKDQIVRNYKTLSKKIKIQSEFLLKNLRVRKKIEFIPDRALDIYEVNKDCFKQTNEYGDCDYDPSKLFDVTKKIKIYLIQLNKRLNRKFKKDKEHPKRVSENTIPLILFDYKTGVGSVNGYKFEFRVGSKSYLLFSELYNNMDKSVSRKQAIKLIDLFGLTKTKQAKRLNNFVKRLRRELGLQANHLILRNSLILKGKKK